MASRFGDQEASTGVSRFGDAPVGSATLAPPPIAAPPNAITGANAFSAPVDSLTGQSRFAEEHPIISAGLKALSVPNPAELSVVGQPMIAPGVQVAARTLFNKDLAKTGGMAALRGAAAAGLSHYIPGLPSWVTSLAGLGGAASEVPAIARAIPGAFREATEAAPKDLFWRAPEPPIWENVPAGGPNIPPVVEPITPAAASGRSLIPAGAPRVHAEIPASNPVAPPSIEPIPGTLPSGRVPGGIQNQVTPVANTGEVVKSVQPITGDINTQEFTGNSTTAAPAHYEGHNNPTAAFNLDKKVIGYLRDKNLEPTANNIQTARTDLGHSRARSGDIDAMVERVKKTMGVLK